MIVDGPECPLNVQVIGDGAPVTLLVHGITGSTDEIEPLAPRITGTRALLDLRGHGRSGAPPEHAGYDHPAMRRDVEHVADAFGATRAVGLSLGAGALLNLLADRPDRFERLVLVSPASIDEPNEGARGLFEEMAERLETQTLDEVCAWSLEGSRDLIARRPRWEELIRRRVSLMNATGIPRALRAYVRGAPPVADADVLRRVEAPVLILAHADDPIHDLAVARRLATLLRCATLQVWDEPLAMFDDEEKLAALVAGFLDA